MHSCGVPNARAFRSGRLMVVLIAILATIFGTTVPAFATPAPVAATSTPPAQTTIGGPVQASLAGFSAGNIISDAVFTDKSTMTEAQIQAFFNSKVKTCRGGYDKYGPIICLKDFKITSVNRPADKYCPGGYTGAANESAARIIYRVSQACNINPQVLIVMLQKEQSLVTHTWPSAYRYDKALGQGCPDGGVPCDPNFVGFFHQIYGAARRMHQYMEDSYFNWYPAGKTSNIYWDAPKEVSPGVWKYVCGAGPVYIANKATSALYYYTPYQPNAAALRAGYGEGDSCSSYGNRNFYNYFTDWFGSTQVPSKPAGPSLPVIDSLATSSFVTALDGDGVLWGYPFAAKKWGNRVRLASGIADPSTVAMAGDTTGSGTRDALIVGSETASIMYGSKTAFQDAVGLNSDFSSAVLFTVAGDVDGDGAPDVLTTDTAGRLLLWPGDQRGSFRAPRQVGAGWSGFDLLVGGVDLSGDGKLDLVARGKDGVLWLYNGDGHGRWPSHSAIGRGWGGMTSIFSPGDFAGTGGTDLLARSGTGDLYLYTNNRGALTSAGVVGVGWDTMVSLGGSGAVAGPARALPAGAGDVDRDGANDVVALMGDGALKLYRGDRTGSWRGVADLGDGGDPKDRVFSLGDFSGDGISDIARIDPTGVLRMYPGDAGGGLGSPQVIGSGWQVMTQVIGGIDFDGDRIPDVLARDEDGRLLLYRGNGHGGWVETGVQIGVGWNIFNAIVNVGDFDGDGYGDLLGRRDDGTLWLYPTSGTSGWKTPRQIGRGWGAFSLLTGSGDFDGDGNPDLLGRSTTGDLYLYSGDGRGSWKGSRVIGWGWQIVADLS